MTLQIVEARAYGKLILFGEHAVVHGQPAIAVPLKAMAATVTAEPMPPGTGLTFILQDLHQHLHLHAADTAVKNTLVYAAQLILEQLGAADAAFRLTLHSTIPIGAGFGSGAAVSTALARALSKALGQPLARESLNELVFTVEKMHHGTPSGIDNTVIVYEQPIFFIKDGPITTFKMACPFHLLVARVDHTTPTHITVGAVHELYEAEPGRIGKLFNRIGQIVRRARQVIEKGEMTYLGPLMNENHALLRELTVSDEMLDRLYAAAVAAGAWGAKLSGGGRGGNLIALIPGDPIVRQNVQTALLEAGAVEVIFTTIGMPE
jgi:mevalonate kinase